MEISQKNEKLTTAKVKRDEALKKYNQSFMALSEFKSTLKSDNDNLEKLNLQKVEIQKQITEVINK